MDIPELEGYQDIISCFLVDHVRQHFGLSDRKIGFVGNPMSVLSFKFNTRW